MQRTQTLIPVLVVLALGVPGLLAGCLTTAPSALEETAIPADPLSGLAERLSKPVYEKILKESLSLKSFDGTVLSVELFRPETPPEVKVPVILVMTPYMTAEDLTRMPYSGGLTNYFAPRGYAVAFGAVRGTHNAGGCLEQTDMKQAQDGYEMVEFLAAQPWSTGKVGMFGASYDGETQQSTATLAPPSLATIVPTASISSQYLYFYHNGVPYDMQYLSMTVYAGIGLAPGHTPEALTKYPERVPCHAENHKQAMSAFSDGRMTPYWQDRDWQARVQNITASVFFIHGLQDWNVKPIHILGWYNEIPSPKKAWLGQWGHAFPTREDWTLTLHRWFDHWLLGVDTGIMDEPPVQVQDSLGRWRHEASFPPREATPWTLYLRRDGMDTQNRLSPQAPVKDEPPQGWTDNPTVAVSALGVDTTPRLVYTTEILPQDTHVSGAPEVTLHVSVSKGSTHIAAHLYDVSPDGRMRLVNRGYMDTLYRDGLLEPKKMTPDEVGVLRFTLNPQDTVFKAGHRIALAVMSDDPYIEQDPSGSRVTVYHDPERPSGITLPLVFPQAFDLVPAAPTP